MDEALATLAGNFSSSNQYFDLLVQVISAPLMGRAMAEMINSKSFQVFSGQVSGGKQPHLANFYLILPPLGRYKADLRICILYKQNPTQLSTTLNI